MAYKFKCPVDHTIWGPLKSQKNLEYAIAKSGQPFGVDLSGPACNTVPSAPCNITYYQYLGFGLHKGIDIPVGTGTDIRAVADGKVSRVSDNVTSGIGVVIYHQDMACESVYWHLKSHSVFPGDTIKTGQLIGISDNTGYSTGPHLHLQFNQTNEHGQSGQAFDPMPYFVWNNDMLTEKDVRKLQALEGYKDESGVLYWTGKPLAEYLSVRLADKLTSIQQAQQ